MQKVKAKKSFGQHFLRDKNIAAKIVNLLPELPENTTIIEVGPGMGILSSFLFEKYNKKVILVDIDAESIEYLHSAFPEYKENIHNKDFLTMDFSEFGSVSIAIIGNFPYNISSQILFKAIENRDKVIAFAGMFQREVARRIVSPPGNKDYGILSVLTQAWFDAKYCFTVEEHLFQPPPQVKSGVILLKRNNVKSLACNEDLFIDVVKTAFNQRRKTLRNALKTKFNLSFNSPILEKRAEQLSSNEFVELCLAIENGKK